MSETIFLSHSTAQADAGRLRMIAERLEAETGRAVWLDKRELQLGDEWYRTVETALASCTAGLVLLSKAALNSDYVLHELTILAHRSVTDREFRLFAINVDPELRRSDLGGSRLRSTRVDAYQIWAAEAADVVDDARLARSIAAKVLEQLGAPPIENRTGRILGALDGALGQAPLAAFTSAMKGVEDLDPGVFDALRADMKGQGPRAQRRLIANWVFEKAASADGLYEVGALVGALKNTRSEIDWKLVSGLIRAAEAYWLGGDPDACPVRHGFRTPRSGIVAMNGRWVPDFTAACFAYRAAWPDRNFIHVTCDGGSRDVEDVIGSIADCLRTPTTLGPMDEERIRRLADKGREPIICVLPKDFVQGTQDWPKLDELSERLRPILFVIWGETQIEPDMVPPGVKAIDPAVDLGAEKAHLTAWGDFAQSLSR